VAHCKAHWKKPFYKASSLTFTIQVHMHILLFLCPQHLLGHHNEDGITSIWAWKLSADF